MEQLQVTQFSGEELDKRFNTLEKKLNNLQENLEPKSPIEYLTRQQTADLLHVDLSTLWSWTKKGKLKAYSISSRVYYKRTEIEESITELNQ